MLNKNYISYLIKSKKYLLIALCIVQAILAFSNFGKPLNEYTLLSNTTMLSYGLGAIVAFVLPLVIFSYVHNKKAVDTYYSLNISRKSLLFTGLVYCFILAFLPFLVSALITFVGYLFAGLIGKYALILLVTILVAFICYILVIVFNTFVYLLANTIFDGVIILLAYYLLPLLLFLMGVNFQETFLIGVYINSTLENILVYFSPIALTVLSFMYANIFNNLAYIKYLVVGIVYIIFFAFFLFKTFNNRKVERAGNYSDNFFAYPFVIGAYTIVCLFIIACIYRNMLSDFSFIILYILLFLGYLIGNFIYKRTFKLSKLQIGLFCMGVVLSLLFNVVCDKTQGFGLSYNYRFEYGKMSYYYYSETLMKDDKNAKDFYDFLDSVKGLEDSDLPNSEYGIYFTLYTNPSSKTITDLMENYRKEAIELYYDDDVYTYNTLSVIYLEDNSTSASNDYRYKLISVEDIKQILKEDSNAYLSIDDWNSGETYYIIYEEGDYVALTSDYYELYENFGYEATKSVSSSNGD